MKRPPHAILGRRSTADRVVEYLRRRIADGILRPGDRIVELEVAAALEVSRSPIREALLMLSQDGLVTILPYRGALVSRLTRERFEHLLRFRLMLEEFAVTEVIRSASDEEIRTFENHIARIRAAAAENDLPECVGCDLDAHAHLIALAKNAFLERAFDETVDLMRMYIRMTSMYYEHTGELAEEHEKLMSALLARDERRARAVLRDHIEHGFQAALAALEG